MFSNWSLKSKLVSSFSLIAIFVALVGTISFFSMKEVSYYYGHIADINLPNSEALGKISLSQKNVVIAVSTLLGTHATVDDFQKNQKFFNKSIENFALAAKDYENIPFVPGEEEKWKQVQAAWKSFEEMSKQLIDLSGSGAKIDEETRDKLAATEYAQRVSLVENEINALIIFQQREAKKWKQSAIDAATLSNNLVIAVVIIGFLLAFSIGLLLAKTISTTMNKIVEQLSTSSSKVASASQQIASSSEQLSSGATEQAASLQETSSSIEEISAMISKNSENAKESNAISELNKKTMNDGKEVIAQMVSAIQEIDASNNQISTQIELSNQEMSEIVKVISEIGNKTKVINDIVFQTKLLSFNASVEAARAGENGKGFAVVAEEVGNLANMSGTAAKEITEMLDESISKVEKIVNSTRTKVNSLVEIGKEKVQSGNEVALRCDEVFGKIATNSEVIASRLHEITNASLEQAEGVKEINKAMINLDQATQQNALASQQSANAAKDLSGQADILSESVIRLIHTVQGK